AAIREALEAFAREKADVKIRPRIKRLSEATYNQIAVEGTISQSISIDPGATRVLSYSIRVSDPSLWNPHDPNLYVLRASLNKDGNFVEDFYTQFGVRTLGIGAGAKLLLNDHAVFFVGEARHEDWWDTGRSATMDKIKSDLDVIQATNVNFLRTAHYPNHPYTYILADRMGFAVSEELPAWWHGTYEWADQNHRQILDQMWREMIFRDFNRPSILFWGTMNEGEGTSMARRRSTIERIHRDLDLNYNDGRFVIQAASADRPGADDHSQNATDVAAWTMYFGVFHGGTHYQGTLDFMDEAHTNFPDKPILNIEYGRISQLDDSEAMEQDTTFNETFDAFEERKAVDANGNIMPVNTGYLAGTMWWTAFNWYTQRELVVQSQGSSHMDRATHKIVRSSIQTRHAPYYNQGGLSTDTLIPTIPPPPNQTIPQQPQSVPDTLLQDFEYEDSYYAAFQAEASLSIEVKYSGNSSLKMTGTDGEWHTVGAYLYQRPRDITTANQICIWVYDTVGRNTVGLRLVDKYGNNQEVWSNSRTQLNKWKQMCFNLSDFDQVDRSVLTKVQMTMYWDGVYYFDELTVDQVSPTPTATTTQEATTTPLPTPTVTPTPTATPSTAMHVEDIYTTDQGGTQQDNFNKGDTVYWRVLILDQNNSPVFDATVRTDISSPDGSPWTNQTTTTDGDGWAYYNKKTKPPDPSGTYTIEVTSVTKEGAIYDPNSNIKETHQYTLQ
ncbi:MAG: glycoside hydrolase family 2 TIM barrel-domain containing protein, partial [Desulfatiglandaceae bacterium]